MSEQDAASGGEMQMPTAAEVVLSSAQLLLTLAAPAAAGADAAASADLDTRRRCLSQVEPLAPLASLAAPTAVRRRVLWVATAANRRLTASSVAPIGCYWSSLRPCDTRFSPSRTSRRYQWLI